MAYPYDIMTHPAGRVLSALQVEARQTFTEPTLASPTRDKLTPPPCGTQALPCWECHYFTVSNRGIAGQAARQSEEVLRQLNTRSESPLSEFRYGLDL